jgi:hypothetical protein
MFFDDEDMNFKNNLPADTPPDGMTNCSEFNAMLTGLVDLVANLDPTDPLESLSILDSVSDLLYQDGPVFIEDNALGILIGQTFIISLMMDSFDEDSQYRFLNSLETGQWVPGASTVAVTDPSDGSVIAQVAIADDAQCEAAIAAADAVAVEWAATAPRFRSEILRKAFEIMTAEIEEIATLISRENGKAMPDARGEATYAAEFFRWFAEETVRTPR